MNKKLWIVITVVVVIVLIFLISIKSKQFSALERKRRIEDSIYQKAASSEEDEKQEALKQLEDFTAEFSGSGGINEVWYAVADIYREQGDSLKAKAAYQRIVRNYPDSEFISEVQKKLWDLNMEILLSPLVTETDLVYEVQAGDSLDAISKKFNTTIALIMRSNNLESAYIRPGKRLKISSAKYSVVIDKSQNALALKSNEQIIKVYKVSTGKDNSTPVGTFKIVNKLIDPVWYKEGAIVPPGSPENELGSRWMGLSISGYGIHGTTDIETVGKYITQGCIRMTNADAEELYAILPLGVEVIIVD